MVLGFLGAGRRRRRTLPFLVLALLCLPGCASRPINEPISAVEPDAGYRPHLLIGQRPDNDPGTLFFLSFSGGGTRAAALSYGLLEELRRTSISVAGEQRRLIDEVDVVTGVSGGSFTALSYALLGERLFDEYEERFLYRNVQGALTRRSFLNPVNWFRLWSPNFGRSELAAEYYDEILFDEATFDDLIDGQGPVAVATGTDMSSGARFAFAQGDFDLICSDLGGVSLSRAAATSSAVPAVLSPVTFNNYGGQCDYPEPAWIADLLDVEPEKRPVGRIRARYADMQRLRDGDNRPYLHLVDGGISDNIGVRGVLDALESAFVSPDFALQRGFSHLRRVVIIVANAHSAPDTDWQDKARPPGMVQQLLQASGVPIERYSYETLELMKDRAAAAAQRRELLVAEAQAAGLSRREAEARYPRMDVHVMEVSFDRVTDPGLRDRLLDLPTTFVLPSEDVDRVRKAAGDVLRQLPEYADLLQALEGEAP
jgi:NTE family protein